MKLSLISAPTNDLLRAKKRVGERRGEEKGRQRIEKDKNIPSTYSLHYGRVRGGRGVRGLRWGGVPIIQLLTAVTG